MNKCKVTIIGAGHGGQTIAGVYASLNYPTTLYNHKSSAKRIEKILQKENKLTIEVLPHCNTHNVVSAGIFQLENATYNISDALKDAPLIHISTSDLQYTKIAQTIAPHLCESSTIFLYSCGLGSALEMKNTLKKNGCKMKNITIAEISALPYSTRVKNKGADSDDGEVEVNLVKKNITLSTLPFLETNKSCLQVHDFFPFTSAKNPLEPALENLGHVFHLPVMFYNIEKWTGKKHWGFYADGYSNKKSKKMVLLLEKERQLIASTIGFHTQTANEFLFNSYGVNTPENKLGEALQKFGYHGRLGPHSDSIEKAISIENGLRQITEEYYCKLHPLLELSRSLKIPTPAMEEVYEFGKEIGLEPNKYARSLFDQGLSKNNLLNDLYTAYAHHD